jgi:altronate dehydratase large subunit
MHQRTFRGYPRLGGKVGVRNYLAIIPTVFCVNEVAAALADRIPNSKPLLHNNGCCELKPDLDRVRDVLCGLISNPNVGGCVLVSLGCEGIDYRDLLEIAEKEGKPSLHAELQDEGGLTACVERCMSQIQDVLNEMNAVPLREFPASKVVMGIKCGSSDTTSGLAANPAVGKVTDHLIENEGRVIFGETTEIIGAEHVLASRCVDENVREALLEMVFQVEDRVREAGVDMRGSQPTPGNIRGGLTTIEEKSLGAICKAGTTPITGVLGYGEATERQGLFVMDSPGKENEIMTGLAAAGVNLIVFTTGGGAPQGFPIVPVIKVASNPLKVQKMREHIDVDASGIFQNNISLEGISNEIWRVMLDVASGSKTRAENLKYDKTIGIYTMHPSI